MTGENQKRRRPVAACVPCYQKKQKCDHQYPCKNCVRRRLPENCSYSHTTQDEGRPKSRDISSNQQLPEQRLSNSLGYLENSRSNLLGLMEEHHLLDEFDLGDAIIEVIPARLRPEMNDCFRLFPKRPILNPLVQLFFQDVNWIYEMMHPTLFLGQYEKWWRTVPGSTGESLHISILILRICAYSAQFFPTSMAEAGKAGGEKLLGVPTDKIRRHCHELASRLQRLCEQLSGPKSLIWVQQRFYAACYEKNEGNIKDAWYTLGSAVHVAQDMGLHVEDASLGKKDMNDLEYDMGRRAFWNLYIWDKFFSLVFDRAPYIVDSYCSTDLPKMRLLNPFLDASAPDVFTERTLQAKLSKLWSSLHLGSYYNPVTAEQNYEKLCGSFISQLPRAFDVHAPDTQWDTKLPNLSRQRQSLRIAIFVTVCRIFQPLLRLKTDQVEALLQFERDLIVQHRDQLVHSAIRVLSSVTELHQLMGSRPQRFFMLSFCTFEPAMLLGLHLLTLDSSQQGIARGGAQSEQQLLFRRPSTVSMSADMDGASPPTCWRYMEQALRMLVSLQDVNTIARVGARKLEQVLAKLDAASSSSSPSSLYGPRTAALSVADETAANDWLGFEIQQLTDIEQGLGGGVDDNVHVHEDEAWGSKVFAQWMAAED